MTACTAACDHMTACTAAGAMAFAGAGKGAAPVRIEERVAGRLEGELWFWRLGRGRSGSAFQHPADVVWTDILRAPFTWPAAQPDWQNVNSFSGVEVP